MAGSGSPQPNRPKKPSMPAAQAPRKPLQVMHISRREEQKPLENDGLSSSDQEKGGDSQPDSIIIAKSEAEKTLANAEREKLEANSPSKYSEPEGLEDLEGLTMEDLLGPSKREKIRDTPTFSRNTQQEEISTSANRSVDDFDFDEEAFLAALDENQPIGNTGEIATGSVIGIDSDGVYVDIGGKAPGFMPKNESGLGVITNFKEKFPKGLKVEVLVTREQNADGMVTISCRALELRKSWEKVGEMEKQGQAVKVKINGFNRGGVTCDLEGLRGFIPRSQLEDGQNHESLVGKTICVAFLEVNPDTRKLVLSEKRAVVVARFAELKVGQLIEGKISAIKPYGFFVDLGGVSGLLHHSLVTNGSMRTLREVFDLGDQVKALITELDPGRGRIGLNTALLEGPPGELLIEKEKVMAEADERAKKARSLLDTKDQEQISE